MDELLYAQFTERRVTVGDDERAESLWREFIADCRTNHDAIEALYRAFCQHGFAQDCRYCGSPELQRRYGARVMKCCRCRRDTWFTSGSFFNRVRMVQPWLFAICLIENGVTISALRFHKIVGIAYAAALNIFKKLTMVLENQMKPEGFTVSSSLFKEAIYKRSRETPCREHPFAEQEAVDRMTAEVLKSCGTGFTSSLATRSSCSSSEQISSMPPADPLRTPVPRANGAAIQLAEPEKTVFAVLSDEPIYIDIICQLTGMRSSELSAALTMLELDGLVKHLPGDRFIRAPAEQAWAEAAAFAASGLSDPARAKDIVAAVVKFIRSRFRGISRKYLQSYLVAHWWHVYSKRWRGRSLLKDCLGFGPVTCKQVLAYVSPPMVVVSHRFA